MTEPGTYIVVDIGKTMSKVSLWTRSGLPVDRRARPNEAIDHDGLRCLDADKIGDWLLSVLREWRAHPVETIIPVAHGAGFAAIDEDGLLFPPLDYEQAIPEDVMDAYRAQRDAFAVTGSPPLPGGLNLGAQIYWMAQQYPAEMQRATLLPWAQYWTWFLTRKAVSEATSLGCHTDLWAPGEGRFSPMAQRLGWAARFARVVKAGDVAGPLCPTIRSRTGFSAAPLVLAGLHDSNAALLAARGFAEIARQEATILSTGTWFIAMRLAAQGFSIGALPCARDTLVNVDAYGWPVPSARFMGGREIETVIQLDTRRVDIRPDQRKLMEEVPALLRRRTMMMPTLAPGFGPFPDGEARWVNAPVEWQGTWYARRAAVCLYAALVADTALDLIGSKERLLIEGRFSEAQVFVRALAALRPHTQVYVANTDNDVSFGALRLVNPLLKAGGGLRRVEPLEGDLQGYRSAWRKLVAEKQESLHS